MEIGAFFVHMMEAAQQDNRPVEEELALAAQNGVRYLQVDGSYWLANEDKVEAWAKTSGIRVGGVDYRVDLAHNQGVGDAERMIRFAVDHGVEQILLIPGFVQQGEKREAVMERVADNLRPLAKLANTLHARLSLEDYDNVSAPYGTWQELKWYLDRVEGLGLSFDTGNFAYFGQNAEEALSELLPWVCIVHCKDRAYHSIAGEQGLQTTDGGMIYPCAVGQGDLPMRSLVGTLRKAGFDGGLTIEHFGCADQRSALRISADNLNKWIRD